MKPINWANLKFGMLVYNPTTDTVGGLTSVDEDYNYTMGGVHYAWWHKLYETKDQYLAHKRWLDKLSEVNKILTRGYMTEDDLDKILEIFNKGV